MLELMPELGLDLIKEEQPADVAINACIVGRDLKKCFYKQLK